MREYNIKVPILKLSNIRSLVLLPVIYERPALSSRSTPELSSRTTISTSSLAEEPSYTSSWSTDDTLSMITTPWTTESWSTDANDDFWAQCDLTSTSATPKTTSSYGISTVFNSYSKTTLTIYSFGEIDTESQSIHPLCAQSPAQLSSTFSSWTVESFTSTGWLSDMSSDLVRVNYPWSPFTEMSLTDTYPSSLVSLSPSFPSIVTIDKETVFPAMDVANDESILVL